MTEKAATLKEKIDLTKKRFSMSEHFSKAIHITFFFLFFAIFIGIKNLLEIGEIV